MTETFTAAHARMVRVVGMATLCLTGAGIALGQGLPFVETFESHHEGWLHNQNDWKAPRQIDGRVQSGRVFEGALAGEFLTNAAVWHDFTDGTATNVWIDFYAQVPIPTNDMEPVLNGSVAAAFYADSVGNVRAISNSHWVVINTSLESNTWYRFSVHLDYDIGRWELHLADGGTNAMSTALATNLAFSASSTNTYLRRFRVRN